MPELKPKNVTNPNKPSSIEAWLDDPSFRDNLQSILPKHLNSERFASVVLRQFRSVPDLKACTPQSVLSGFMDAAMLGLEIGINGEAYLIPFNNKVKVPDGEDYWEKQAQLQIGYLGHLKLAWNSGLVASIEADVVTHEEVDSGRFDYQRGDTGFIRHKPIEGREVGEQEVAFSYGLVWIKGSDKPIWRVLDAKQIDKLRKTGKSANFPAWRNHFAEMAMAKALKRTLKWAPKSPEMSHSIALDDLADAGVVQSYNSSGDVAGLLGEPAPKTAAQEMMDDASTGNGSPPRETVEANRDTRGSAAPNEAPKDEQKQAPKPGSDMGW